MEQSQDRAHTKAMTKSQRVKAISTGWTGIITMAGKTIVQVRFEFETFGGRKRSIKSAWRVSDLKAL